jgi:hypothetical protein
MPKTTASAAGGTMPTPSPPETTATHLNPPPKKVSSCPEAGPAGEANLGEALAAAEMRSEVAVAAKATTGGAKASSEPARADHGADATIPIARPRQAVTPSRRGLLALLAASPIMVGAAALPALAGDDDAEILATDAKHAAIMKLIEPYQEAREALRCKRDGLGGGLSPEYKRVRARVDAFDVEHGLDILCKRTEELTEEICDFQDRMFALAAATEAGRRSKVRVALKLAHCWRDPWRGSADDLEYSTRVIRGLLGEYAGMTEEEVENV